MHGISEWYWMTRVTLRTSCANRTILVNIGSILAIYPVVDTVNMSRWSSLRMNLSFVRRVFCVNSNTAVGWILAHRVTPAVENNRLKVEFVTIWRDHWERTGDFVVASVNRSGPRHSTDSKVYQLDDAFPPNQRLIAEEHSAMFLPP